MAKMIAMKRMTYGTRRLKAGDEFTAPRRDARILDAIGKATYGTRDLVADATRPAADGRVDVLDGQGGKFTTFNQQEVDRVREQLHPLDHDCDGRKGGSKAGAGEGMKALRAKYQEVVGKRPFPGWDAAELQRRMKEASAAE